MTPINDSLSVYSDKLQSPSFGNILNTFLQQEVGGAEEVILTIKSGALTEKQTVNIPMPCLCERKQQSGLLITPLEGSTMDQTSFPSFEHSRWFFSCAG